jgi:hypothetical protein
VVGGTQEGMLVFEHSLAHLDADFCRGAHAPGASPSLTDCGYNIGVCAQGGEETTGVALGCE